MERSSYAPNNGSTRLSLQSRHALYPAHFVFFAAAGAIWTGNCLELEKLNSSISKVLSGLEFLHCDEVIIILYLHCSRYHQQYIICFNMRNPYYLIWVDTLINGKKYYRNEWKVISFFLITFSNAMNVFTIYLWLKYFDVVSYLIKIDIFPGTILNNAAGFFIQFAVPFFLINYFLIFYNDRYKKLIGKYPSSNGKLAVIYMLSSIWIGVISTIIYGILK